MSESYAPITYTVKGGKNYDRPWCVFHGDTAQIRHHAITMFGLDADELAELSTAEVMMVVEEILQGNGNVKEQLGATVIRKPSEAATGASKAGSDPWAGVGETGPALDAAEANPFAALIEQIEAAGTEDALKVLWAKNKAAFSDTAVKDAYVARRAAIKA